MIEWDLLLKILRLSIKKNGNKPLTILHLINIMEMVNRKIEEHEDCLMKLIDEVDN